LLLVAGQAMPNVQDALVQLGSRSRSTFFHFHADIPVDVISLLHIYRLYGELYLPDFPFWVLM
jgi:hypothetical protein